MTDKEAIERLNLMQERCCNGYDAEAIYLAKKALENERPQGEWITWEEAGNYIASPNRHECSCCHDSAQVLVNGIELLSDFCPNCGADMRVKDELGGRG